MNIFGWLDPKTGLPPLEPYKEFIPAQGSPRPLYPGVTVSGTLEADAGSSSIELAGVSLAGPGWPVRHPLWYERLSLDYAPPIELDYLRRGNRCCLLADLDGYLTPHLRGTEWEVRGTAREVLWSVPPPPP